MEFEFVAVAAKFIVVILAIKRNDYAQCVCPVIVIFFFFASNFGFWWMWAVGREQHMVVSRLPFTVREGRE